jgi:dephospho-CoA kinase
MSEVSQIDLPRAPDTRGREPARSDVAVDGHVMNAELFRDLRQSERLSRHVHPRDRSDLVTDTLAPNLH